MQHRYGLVFSRTIQSMLRTPTKRANNDAGTGEKLKVSES